MWSMRQELRSALAEYQSTCCTLLTQAQSSHYQLIGLATFHENYAYVQT